MHEMKCSDEEIRSTCRLFMSIFSSLDIISSKLRMKQGEPKEEDYTMAETAVDNLEYLWGAAGLSKTPKFHGGIDHAVKLMRRLQGYGDMLEDDVELAHQTGSRFDARINRLKHRDKRAISLSKMEAVSFNREVQKAIEITEKASKRKFVNRKMELSASERKKKSKMERDESREAISCEVQKKPFGNRMTTHETLKLAKKSNT